MRVLPELRHCKENIIHVLKDYNRAVSMGYIVLNSTNYSEKSIYQQDKYKIIKSNKTTISNAKKDPNNLWSKIRKDVFDTLVKVLYDHRDDQGEHTLTVWDDAAIYSNDAAVFHGINHFYNGKKEFCFQELNGKYRTYKAATSDTNIVLAGTLIIKFIPETNTLCTQELFNFDLNGEKVEYDYNGFINYYRDQNHLIWNDVMDSSVRQTRLVIRPAEDISMEGLMFLNLSGKHFVRKIFIDSCHEGEDKFAAHRNDDRIPEKYKKDLGADSIHIHEFAAFI